MWSSFLTCTCDILLAVSPRCFCRMQKKDSPLCSSFQWASSHNIQTHGIPPYPRDVVVPKKTHLAFFSHTLVFVSLHSKLHRLISKPFPSQWLTAGVSIASFFHTLLRISRICIFSGQFSRNGEASGERCRSRGIGREKKEK